MSCLIFHWQSWNFTLKQCIGFLIEMLHRSIKWNYPIDIAITLMGYTTLLNIQWRSYRIYYFARDQLEKTLLPGGIQYDRSPAKNIPNKFGTQSPRRWCEKWRKKRRTGDEREAASRYIVRSNVGSDGKKRIEKDEKVSTCPRYW